MFCTYLVYHPTTLRYYIGKSTIARIFGKKKYMGGGTALAKCFKKYPKSEWYMNVLGVFLTEDEAYAEEAILVNEEILSDERCLNLECGGRGGMAGRVGGFKGGHHTAEARKKISKYNKGKKHSPESRANMSAARKGVPSPLRGCTFTDEHKANISTAKKGKPGVIPSEETRKKMSQSHIGKGKGIPLSEEHKEKMRNVVFTEDRKQKIANALSGKTIPDVVKEKMRWSHKVRNAYNAYIKGALQWPSTAK
jgi:hypothetical protein